MKHYSTCLFQVSVTHTKIEEDFQTYAAASCMYYVVMMSSFLKPSTSILEKNRVQTSFWFLPILPVIYTLSFKNQDVSLYITILIHSQNTFKMIVWNIGFDITKHSPFQRSNVLWELWGHYPTSSQTPIKSLFQFPTPKIMK